MKGLEDKFAEVEKRVRTLATENRILTKRIGDLERELAQARREAQRVERFHGKQAQIREKLERVLQSLDALGTKE